MNYEKYKGHTPEPWVSYEDQPIAVAQEIPIISIEDNKHQMRIEIFGDNRNIDASLILDAPKLLKRCQELEATILDLREEIFILNDCED